MVEIGLPRLRMSQRFLQHLFRAVSRFSRGAVAGVTPSARFRSNWVKYDYNRPSDRKKRFLGPIGDSNRIDPFRIEEVLTVISCNWAPGEAGNSSG